MFLNLSLLRSPYNWVTVWLMALLGLMLLAIITPEEHDIGA